MTNRIANEACIDVDYDERHPPAAVVDRVHAERAAAHGGVSVDIGVAALFAAVGRRADLDAVGGLSERYQLGQFDDDDLSHRIRAQLGRRIVCCDDLFVHHAGMSAFGSLDPHLLDGLFTRNRRVFEAATRSTWRPHRRRDASPHPDPEETTMDPSAHADPRVAELESELSAVRRDYQDKLVALTRNGSNGSAAHPPADAGLYEMLLGLERERSDARAHVHAEYLRRVEAETERDRLAAENADLTRQRDEADARAAMFIGQVRTLEASLAWRLGRALLNPLKRLPGLRRLGVERRRLVGAGDGDVVAPGHLAQPLVVAGEQLGLRGGRALEHLQVAARPLPGGDGAGVVEGVAGVQEPAVAVLDRVGGVAAGVAGQRDRLDRAAEQGDGVEAVPRVVRLSNGAQSGPCAQLAAR